MSREVSFSYSFGPGHVHSVFYAVASVGDLCEVIFSKLLLCLRAKGAVVGGDCVQVSALQVVKQVVVCSGVGVDRRGHNEAGSFFEVLVPDHFSIA